MPENFEQPKPLSQRASDPKNIDLSQSEAKPDDKVGDVNGDKNERNENILNLLELFWKKGGDEAAMEKAAVMSKDEFSPKEIQEKVALIVKNSVYSKKSYEYCLRVKDCFNLDDNLFENAICYILISRLDSEEYEEVIRIRDSYGLPKHYLQEAILKKIKEYLINHSYNKLIKLKEALGVDDAVIKSPENVAMIKGEFLKFIDEVDYDSLSFIIDIQKLFNLPESFLTSSEVKERVVKKITRGIGKLTLRSDNILFLKNLAHLPDDVFQNSVMQGIINYLKSETAYSNEITILEEIKNAFNLSGLLRSSEELKEALRYRVKKAFMYGNYSEQIMMIKNFIGMTDEDFNTPEIRDALFKRMSDYISGDISDKSSKEELESIGLSRLFSFGPELLHSSEMQERIIKDVVSHGGHFWRSNRSIDYWIRLKELFLTEESINSDSMQSFVAEEVKFFLGNKSDINSAIKLSHDFSLSGEVIKDIFLEIVIRLLENEESKAIELVDNLNPSENFFASQELKGVVIKIIAKRISSGNFDEAVTFQEKFKVDFGEVQGMAKVKAQKILSSGSLEDFLKITERFEIDIAEFREMAKQVAEKQLLGGSLEDFLKITERFEIDIQQPEFKDIFTAATLFCRVEINDPVISELISNDLTELDLKRLFVLVQEKSPEWQDEQTIAGPFQAGAETFGYKRMLEYIKRDNLSLHDAVHTFRDVLELFRASGLGESEFYGQVLQQVRMDDREYSEGTAHHHLNAIAQTANKNVAEVIGKVQEYKEIERLQELAKTFSSPQAVFASWINLKRYSELEQLLGQTEVFDELKKLKAEGKEALYKYIETLAFHPDSKVNMSAVIQFWREPESFLAAEASHTPYEVHNRKKPSNYINMPNLDLTASELRDALVEGKMDGLSAFTPLEIHYIIPMEEIKQEPLPDLVNKALGSNKKGIEGVARNSKKLFSELGKLLKPHGLSVVDYIQGKVLPEGIDLSHQIETLLYDRDFGMERPLVKTREFVARISRKSDPEGAIAGDDTVNCMPFGDGKNTVYTFNPNTAQFVIRLVKGDGKERTIAQSVLTKDMNVKVPIPDLITKLQQEGGHLEDILPADILSTAPVYVACDNVEVTPNYSDEKHQQIIETIFRDFFREYMSRYATKEGLDTKKMPIGQGYTDALSQLPIEMNTFAPQAPVSYSDKTGPNVYMLDLTSEKGLDLIWQKDIKESEVRKRTEVALPKIKGLGYLTFEDTLKVGYIEGKAYSDNQSLMQFLFNVENGLIAKDINNSAKDRPNMSLKYTDGNGQMRGYLLSWEGKLADENVENNAEEFFGQPCVYIIDVASDKENRMAGGRLIQGFAELYKRNYLDKGNAVPIFAQAREATSYQIVKQQLNKLGKDAGFNFELVELPTYEVGEDVMHPIIIRPTSTRT